ncbi:sensor histidine kinase [Paucibacter sp. AS339]|uniref:sensor histidine kinase n=1 Tax=Paucibacter hankyongi TaxID=3133434 RepID=UPI0030A15852
MLERLAACWPDGLRQRLLLGLAAPLTVVLLLALVINHRAAQQMTDAAFDKALLNVAVALAARVEIDSDNDLDVDLPASAQALLQADTVDQMRMAVLDESGRFVWGDGGLQIFTAVAAARAPASPGAAGEELAQTMRCEGQVLRVLVLPRQGPFWRARVVVAETTRKRDAAAQRLLFNSAALGLALWACALLTLWLVTRHLLRPLERAAALLERRPAGEWQPLDTQRLPLELRGLLGAINGLLVRLQGLSQAQQRFIGDVAHQLRTPLAGLRLQLDLLRQDAAEPAADGAGAVTGRMVQMTLALDRMGRLVAKLLALARANAEAMAQEPFARLDLRDTAESCASEFFDQAQQRGIDLSFELEPAPVRGRRGDLHEMASNLLENAFLHGRPVNAHVCMRTGEALGQPFLEVEDDGPGMAPALQRGLFQRFQAPSRGAAHSGEAGHQRLGLGLAIVQTIAEQHGARIELGVGREGVGTCVRVWFPAASGPLGANAEIQR